MDALAIFNEENFHAYCDILAGKDNHLLKVIHLYGYPPLWTRKNSFETLVHIILEQQVSLASALAALNKLKEKAKSITPDTILQLTDGEMRDSYVSRQKTGYIRSLAQAIRDEKIHLNKLKEMTNDEVYSQLIPMKGFGKWTIDVYLMFALRRTDIFPIGDLAVVKALKDLKQLAPTTTKDELLQISSVWAPLRSIAAMILWHYYLSYTGKKQVFT